MPGRLSLGRMAKTDKPMTEQERREEMRRRIMIRWRDKTKVTPATLELVKHACADGATVSNICHVLEINEHTFYRWKDTVPEFANAVREGRRIEHDRLVNKLTEVALAGNVTALIFALKSRHNYVDSGVGAATLVENKVAITFQLPDSLSPKQYLETLTAGATTIAPSDARRALDKPGVKTKVMKELGMEKADATTEI